MGVLMLMLVFGYEFGILSDDPDGLERTIIDTKADEYSSDRSRDAPLGGINNDFIISIIGISLTFIIIIGVLYIFSYSKKKKTLE